MRNSTDTVTTKAVTTHGSERLLNGLLARFSFVGIRKKRLPLKHTRLNKSGATGLTRGLVRPDYTPQRHFPFQFIRDLDEEAI
jgi:hypothetical protein